MNVFQHNPSIVKASVIASQKLTLSLTTKVLDGVDLIPFQLHDPLCNVLDKVIKGDIKRLIISMPPGYGKTSTVVWSFIARSFVVNPRARFIHTSYSQDLVLDNSSKVKEVLMSDEFQYFNDFKFTDDTKAKGLWRTDVGGGMRSVQTGGGITGFRAGYMDKSRYTGAIIMDDTLKPADGTSRLKVSKYNERYNSTVSSRLAHEDVPIVLIMQRLCSFPESDNLTECGDMAEFLLRGGSGEKWDHLLLPLIIDKSASYPKEYTHGRPLNHGLPDGMLEPYKHDEASAKRLGRANKYVYAAQYMQYPLRRLGNMVFDVDDLHYFDKLECTELRKIIITSDTASKTKEANDYSVFMASALMKNGNIYILDVKRGKWESPELIRVAQSFWNKWKRKIGDNRMGASSFYCEDKSSGIALIQTMRRTLKKQMVGIPRNVDKFTRALGVLPILDKGVVHLPSGAITDSQNNFITNAEWVHDFVNEYSSFTDDDTHLFDDMIDTFMDALEKLGMTYGNIYDNIN